MSGWNAFRASLHPELAEKLEEVASRYGTSLGVVYGHSRHPNVDRARRAVWDYLVSVQKWSKAEVAARFGRYPEGVSRALRDYVAPEIKNVEDLREENVRIKQLLARGEGLEVVSEDEISAGTVVMSEVEAKLVRILRWLVEVRGA